jgi:hypothetical protein
MMGRRSSSIRDSLHLQAVELDGDEFEDGGGAIHVAQHVAWIRR